MERAAAVATRVIETSGSLAETDAAVDAALGEALRAAVAGRANRPEPRSRSAYGPGDALGEGVGDPLGAGLAVGAGAATAPLPG